MAMKPMLEVALQEWALTRDKLFDTFVAETGMDEKPPCLWFIMIVKNQLNLDIRNRCPLESRLS